MNQDHHKPPIWMGASLAGIGIVGVLMAGMLWPVADDRPLKMSCFWAMRGAIAVHLMIGLAGIAALLAETRDGARTAAVMAIGAGVVMVLTMHLLIPVMDHHAMKQRAHDVLGLAAILISLAGLLATQPEQDVDEALDAVAAATQQPGPPTS